MSHSRSDYPCQDSCASLEIEAREGNVLALVCSDGAGSGKYTDAASQLLCNDLLQCVIDHFANGKVIGEVDKACISRWINSTRTKLSILAEQTGSPLNDYACTVTLALVDDYGAVFAQIGDGAIVIGTQTGFDLVFAPPREEYLNVTSFITSDNCDEALEYLYLPYRLSEVALITDGLQLLALCLPQMAAHTPFFQGFFSRLRGEEDAEQLNRLLTTFLDSTQVNNRTDDDKTLILAYRPPCHPAIQIPAESQLSLAPE
jgi:hypothetical protein